VVLVFSMELVAGLELIKLARFMVVLILSSVDKTEVQVTSRSAVRLHHGLRHRVILVNDTTNPTGLVPM